MMMAKKLLRTVLAVVATFALLMETASAQLPMPSVSLGGASKRKLSPEEQAKQDALDADYKAATTKIPDQQLNDPWATVRPAPPAATAAAKTKKKPPQ